MNKFLYIGLNGYAGSGKDTVAKMLHHILNKDWNSYDECKNLIIKMQKFLQHMTTLKYIQVVVCFA